MDDRSYEFDPCTLDGSDKEEITLDNWKQRKKEKTIIQSQWRKTQIGSDFNQQPGLDDLGKIAMFLKKKKSDAEIMHVFGISAETLIAIKKNKYCPVEGIALDNLSKIYNEFENLKKRMDKVERGADYLSKVLFLSEDDLKEYKDYCKPPKYKKNNKDNLESNPETGQSVDQDENLIKE